MNLLFATIGCILGTLIGVLPGLGPAAGTALLIPITFKLEPTSAIIMLAAIYYGAMYGGTITSVLINVPGEAASVVTCLDGYEMAKQGRAGAALGIAAIGSFIGGNGGDLRARPRGAPADPLCPEVRPAGVLLAPSGRPLPGHGPGGKVADQGPGDGDSRPDLLLRRGGPRRGGAAFHLRHRAAHGRDPLRPGGHGLLRHRRDPDQRGKVPGGRDGGKRQGILLFPAAG